MFGEEYMAFISENKIDNKGRLTLPKETKAEKDEVLYLGLDEGTKELQIGTFHSIFTKIEELNNKLNETDDVFERISISKCILKLKKLIILKLRVDKYRRVLLTNEVRELYDLDKDTIYIKGNMDVINLYSNKEDIKGLSM